jgi:hypothetical protein
MKEYATHHNSKGEYQSTPRVVLANSLKEAAKKLNIDKKFVYLKAPKK